MRYAYLAACSSLLSAIAFLTVAGSPNSAITLAADVPATAPATAPSSVPLSDIEQQIVFPGSRSQGHAYTLVRPPAGCELLALHAPDQTKIAAIFGRPTGGAAGGAKPALLFFYGNGMCMADSMSIVNEFRALGFNVIVVDYPGYGMSGGTPSEAGCYAAADAAYDYLLARNDVDHKRIVACGWSLGSGVAIHLASHRRLAGLATFSAFTNTDHMIERTHLPITLASKFDNLSTIASVSCPIFMAHGTEDPLVPIDMLDQLTKAAKSKLTVVRLSGAAHNDLFQRGGQGLYRKLKTFVNGLPEVAPSTQP
jgi:hypothetical protein